MELQSPTRVPQLFLEFFWHHIARLALLLPVEEAAALSMLCRHTNSTLHEERWDLGKSYFEIAERIRYGMCGERINVQKASFVYIRAARLHYPGAVGKCWMLGLDGRDVDPDKALQAYLAAAEAPFFDRNAMFQLGRLYYLGEGDTAQDLKLSFEYTLQASERGHPVAQFNLGRLFFHGTPDHERDYKKAVFWYKKSADQGYGYAQHNLALCLQEGQGCEEDLQTAARYLKMAAKQGPDQRNAMNLLAYVYHNGEGVEQSYEEAFHWWMEAAKAGDVKAQCKVGDCYQAGHGVESNNIEMARWYRQARQQDPSFFALVPIRVALLAGHLPALEALEAAGESEGGPSAQST